MIRSIVTASILLSSAALATAPSFAAPGETVSRAVPTADLNLASEAGRARLRTRVASAIAGMCGSPEPRDLASAMAVQHCRATARKDGETKMAMLIDGRQRLATRDAGRAAIGG